MANTIAEDIHSTYTDVHIPREEPRGNYLFILSLAALGVVYGDIGTSPLYALRECFHGPHAIAVTPANILGVLSLIFWSLIIVISVKYLIFVVRADNEGEGGILSLAALTTPIKPSGKTEKWFLIALGIFGAALLYGDGVLTPAISVLSAMEGMSVATPALSPYIVPLTIVIIVGLFFIQSRGTAGIGKLFGPVTLVWFSVLAILGVAQIFHYPQVLSAVNPFQAISFFIRNGGHGFIILGSVFLVVTGGEALYADMGHFGKKPIRHGVVCGRASGTAFKLFRAGRITARKSRRSRQSVLSSRARLGIVSDDNSGDDGNRHRLASRHFRRVFADDAGDSTRIYSASENQSHIRQRIRADLSAGNKLGVDDRLYSGRFEFSNIEQSRRRLRHRRHFDDGYYERFVLRRRPEALELGLSPDCLTVSDFS